MGSHWSEGLLWALDTETTGLDPQGDRLVSVALVCVAPDGKAVHPSYATVIYPGVHIPDEASRIHGITDEVARAQGISPEGALRNVARLLGGVRGPLVVMHAQFDVPFLLAEFDRRYIAAPALPPLFDPLVVDRALDRYRKGSRKLAALCAHYGIPLTDAHTAGADAVAAAQVARAMVRRYPAQLGAATPEALHAAQVGWHAEWARGWNAHNAVRGRPERARLGWPVGSPEIEEVEAGA